MEKYKKTLVTLGLWLGFQLIVTAVFYAISIISHTDFNLYIAPALLISDGLVAISLIAIRYCKIKDLFVKVPKDAFMISVIMAISALFAIDLISQNLNIPDIFEEQFQDMTKTFIGFLGICIVGPLMEEIMMRRVIMTNLAQATGHVWWGIILSATIFAVIHGNPIQMVFALPAGVIFGWLYYKTGSLMVPVCIHIINNTISFFTIKYSLDFKINISTTLGFTIFMVLVIITVASIIWIHRFYADKAALEASAQEEPAIREE
jgi:hypothetical protein